MRTRLPYAVLALVQLGASLLFLLDRAPGTGAALDGLPLDDAWIHLVYARSLAALDGFAYNPGVSAAGFSSPLWVLLLAPLHWGPASAVVYGAKALGMALAWACSALGYRIARDLTDSQTAGWIAGLAIALDPALGFARVSGMEVMLAAVLLLGAFERLLRGRPVAALLLAGLAPFARPENALFAALAAPLLGAALLRARVGWRGWLLALGPALVLAAGWLWLCLDASGRPLPNTFYVKATGGLGSLRHNAAAIGLFLVDLPWFYLGGGFVLYAAGARRLLRAHGSRSERAARALLVGYPLAFFAAVALTTVLLQPLPFYWSRYLLPVLPLLLVVLAIGGVSLFGHALEVLRRGEAPPRVSVIAGLGAFACMLSLVTLPGSLLRSADRYAWNAQNIEEMQVALAHWLRDHVPAGERIASVDAGAVRYFGEHEVLDLMGLNSREVLDRGMVGALAAWRPRYVVVFPALFPKLRESGNFRPLHRVRAENYTVCPACPQDELVVYEWVGSR